MPKRTYFRGDPAKIIPAKLPERDTLSTSEALVLVRKIHELVSETDRYLRYLWEVRHDVFEYSERKCEYRKGGERVPLVHDPIVDELREHMDSMTVAVLNPETLRDWRERIAGTYRIPSNEYAHRERWTRGNAPEPEKA